MIEAGLPPCAWATRILELCADYPNCLVVVPEGDDSNRLVGELRATAPQRPIHHFRDDDQSPYAPLSPDPAPGWGRLALGARLSLGESFGLVIADASALGRALPDLATIADASTLLSRGQELIRDQLMERLERAGYHRVPAVEDPGTVALRGSVIDLWPPSAPAPVRADFFGDEIETLRHFDPATQRQGQPVEMVIAAPARAFSVGPDIVRAQRNALIALGDELQLPSALFTSFWQRLEAGVRYPGVEALEPILRTNNTCLLELLPEKIPIICCDPSRIDTALNATDTTLFNGFEQRSGSELIAPPALHRLDRDAVRRALRRFDCIDFDPAADATGSGRFSDLEDLRQDLALAGHNPLQPESDPLAPLEARLRRWRQRHFSTIISCESASRTERLTRLLDGRGLTLRRLAGEAPIAPDRELTALRDPSVFAYLTVSEHRHGFIDHQRRLVLLPERLITGRRTSPRGQRPTRFKTTLADLKINDLVIHLDFGLGCYQGIERRVIDGLEHDFIRVDFRDADKVFVPVARISMLRRYDGAGTPKLDKIGGSAWQKRCARVRAGLLEIAHRLVETQARRASFAVKPLADSGDAGRAFEAEFPFVPTADQEAAFGAVAEDLASRVPMDRLICGDVGFGKTEVAMRAAHTAILAGQQVAILVPTTVLCQQHLRSFCDRFSEVGARIEALSRLHSAAATAETLRGLASGAVDIVIGTHKLLGATVRFKDLGLLVIDEEQRFGVRHKERIKEICRGVNVLTMTATPIPRTLQLAMVGARELSVIETPPPARHAVRTMVCRYEDGTVRDAIRRELDRGGQVFFLHNRVADLDGVAGHLSSLVPEARISIAHGQMAADTADAAMVRFVRGEANLLVCTTIIESGLDIPNANTILVHRADRFGLAQLHQIRGRVGRRRERGYCYLLLRQDEDVLHDDARRRLDALRRLTELGSGMRIAREDLDIRGAGNLIGADQSGHIEAIGLEFYSELLAEAIARIKGGEINSLNHVDIRIGKRALIPPTFMPDAAERISLYDRLARADDDDKITAIEEELVDRYGALPDALDALLDTARARWRAGAAGISEVVARTSAEEGRPPVTIAATFEAESNALNPAALVAWIKRQNGTASLTASGRLVWKPVGLTLERYAQDPARLTVHLTEIMRGLKQAN